MATEYNILTKLLDEDFKEDMILFDLYEKEHKFKKCAVFEIDFVYYAILKPLTKMKKTNAGDLIVFRVSYAPDGEPYLDMEKDKKVINFVLEKYEQLNKTRK